MIIIKAISVKVNQTNIIRENTENTENLDNLEMYDETSINRLYDAKTKICDDKKCKKMYEELVKKLIQHLKIKHEIIGGMFINIKCRLPEKHDLEKVKSRYEETLKKIRKTHKNYNDIMAANINSCYDLFVICTNKVINVLTELLAFSEENKQNRAMQIKKNKQNRAMQIKKNKQNRAMQIKNLLSEDIHLTNGVNYLNYFIYMIKGIEYDYSANYKWQFITTKKYKKYAKINISCIKNVQAIA
ncbi:hypothetical protein BDAP_001435 [Binucleata daphniae]